MTIETRLRQLERAARNSGHHCTQIERDRFKDRIEDLFVADAF